MAEHNIDKVTGEFEPNKFEDRYENAMIELIRSKQAGLPAPKEKAASRPANVVNLMGALRRSIDGGAAANRPASETIVDRGSWRDEPFITCPPKRGCLSAFDHLGPG